MIHPLLIVLALLTAGVALAAPETAVRQTSGTYHVQLPDDPGAVAADVRLLPARTDGAVTGMRLQKVAADSLVARAGLREGDIIRGIDNRPIADVEAAIEALQAGVDGGRLFLHVERDGHRLALTYIIEKAKAPTVGSGRGLNPDTAEPVEPLDVDWITEQRPGHYTLVRAGFDAALSDPQKLARSARLIPAREGDRFVGFKLYGMRPRTLLPTLGLRNGDILRTVNGLPLASPQQALDAYSRLRAASTIVLSITRGDETVKLTYDVHDDPVAPPPAEP